MKPTQQEIIEFAKQAKLGTALSHGGGDLRIFIEGADWHEELQRFAELLLESFGAGGGEPVAYLTEDFERCVTARTYNGAKKGGGAIFYGLKAFCVPVYTHPSPTDLRAEYLRGLEEAAKVCDQQSMLQLNQHIMRCLDKCAAAIRSLKGKQ